MAVVTFNGKILAEEHNLTTYVSIGGTAAFQHSTLQTRGVESRLIYYPDENHWVLKPNNSLHWYGEVRDWVERFAAPGGRGVQSQPAEGVPEEAAAASGLE